jgi:ADP-heptose:LPS heptosyltransferase
MHLADALGIPVIALFGQGKLPLWAPSGQQSRIVTHQDDPDFFLCHPIEENTAFARQFMDRISVAEVLAAVEALSLPLSSPEGLPSAVASVQSDFRT